MPWVELAESNWASKTFQLLEYIEADKSCITVTIALLLLLLLLAVPVSDKA
jgi:hypothetical protein